MSGQHRYPNIVRKGGNFYAYLAVPIALQPLIGRKFFQASTGETNQAKAYAVAAPMLAQWRARLDVARKEAADPLKADIRRLTALHKQAVGSKLDSDAEELWAGVAQFFHDRMTLGASILPADYLDDGRGKLERFEAVRVEPKVATPLLAHFLTWQDSGQYQGQQLKTSVTHIEAFALAVPQSLESLTSHHVQAWVDGLLKEGTNDNTIRNRLYSVKNYWRWMSQRGLAPNTSKPFDDIEVDARQSPAERAALRPLRFEPAELPLLWAKAAHDVPLYAMIRIAAYSGARREAIATLKVANIFFDAPVPFFKITDDKTQAGIRDVPIHSEILAEMRELARNADADGYLIHSTATASKRGDALGKRFSKMKSAMGFDGRRDFHSIRRTVIHLFEARECPEGVAKDVVGHAKKSITYGTYSGVTGLEQKALWLEKAIKYPA